MEIDSRHHKWDIKAGSIYPDDIEDMPEKLGSKSILRVRKHTLNVIEA